MKAAIGTEIAAGAKFSIVDVELDAPIGREVLVDVKASGLTAQPTMRA